MMPQSVKSIDMDERNTAYFTYSGGTFNLSLFITSIILWALSVQWYPNLDGVSVYETSPVFPNKDLFKNMPSRSNKDEAFTAEALMLNYCVFPKVYNELITLNTESNGVISTYLKSRGLTQSQADNTENIWKGIVSKFSALERSNTEYNLPYDDIIVQPGKIELSAQHFPPVCRCINKVLNIFEKRGNTADEFNKATESINNCLTTRHIVKRQTLVGSSGNENNDIKNRKYISRYALLFQLCLAFAISYFYNKINFLRPIWGCDNDNWNGLFYFALAVVIVLLWLCHVFSGVNSIRADNAISFSSLLTLPALALGFIVEYTWSVVAHNVDIGRQTFMHPLNFFFVMSSLYTIALIENGVFTMSVIVSHILQCNAMSMAYAGALFVAHGKLWKFSTSSRAGFILLLFLPAMMHLIFLVPAFPVKCELNLLWYLPVVFAVLCYAKLLLIDHLMHDEPNTDGSGKFKITHSDYFLIRGQALLISSVVGYYIIQLAILSYAKSGYSMMGMSGGRLSDRLNFEFGEMNFIGRSDMPVYNSVNINASDVFYFNS